ncbi:hypothetical protein [Streptomyces sp. NPDC058045]|uniref:hypothetical protein n=1 Tax=Streptomyces sp. NPDC058045 TaxID=3346311 RepID=UPI0036EE93CE
MTTTKRAAELRRALRSFNSECWSFDAEPTVRLLRGYEVAWNAALPWLPLAQQRLGEAAGSPSERARWQELIDKVRPPKSGRLKGTSYADLVSLCAAVRAFLNALLDAERPGPTVAEIAEYVRRAVRAGHFLPGEPIHVGQIAEEVGSPPDRVRRALQDVGDSGANTLTAAGQLASVSVRPMQTATAPRPTSTP